MTEYMTKECEKRVYVFVNGIMTMPGASANWNSKATTHSICYRKRFAEKLEYFSGFLLSRKIWQRKRVERLRKKLQRFINEEWKIVLVGHSNGAAVILDALRDMDYPEVEQIHLISAACDGDFHSNGLNEALKRHTSLKTWVYIAEKDLPLRLAGSLLGWLVGFGTLGRTGPMRLDASVSNRVEIIREPDFGHSTWFEDDNFEKTMERIFNAT